MKRSLIARTIAYLALAVLISMLAGCASNDESGPSGEAKQPVSTSGSPVDALTQSMRAHIATKSYRVRITSSNPNIPGETLVEFVAPDRLHISSQIGETIAVGSDSYTRRGQGPWQKDPIDASQIVAKFRDPNRVDDMAKNYDVKLIGPNTLDGVPVVVYEYTTKNPSAVTPAEKTKIWIGADDSLPRKMETESLTDKSVLTRIFSDYNADIKINLPV